MNLKICSKILTLKFDLFTGGRQIRNCSISSDIFEESYRKKVFREAPQLATSLLDLTSCSTASLAASSSPQSRESPSKHRLENNSHLYQSALDFSLVRLLSTAQTSGSEANSRQRRLFDLFGRHPKRYPQCLWLKSPFMDNRLFTI